MTINRPVKRVLADLKQHPWLHVISISTIAVALLIVGGYLLCYQNFEILARRANPQVSGTLYLKEGLSKESIRNLQERLLSLANIEKAEYKTRDTVVSELRFFLGKNESDNLPGIDIFPDVLEVQLKAETSTETFNVLKGLVSRLPEVAEVDFSEDWLAQYKRVRYLMNVFGLILLIGVIVACSFIIANSMGIRHQSRKEEIEIVRLVGAHRNFILAPFVWEGVFEGVFGGALALALLFLLKKIVSALVSVQWNSLIGIKEWSFLSLGQLCLIVIIGVVMALCGGMTVFLRIQKQTFE